MVIDTIPRELAERMQANAELLQHSPYRVQKNAARYMLDKHISTEHAQHALRLFLQKADRVMTELGHNNTIQPSEIVELLYDSLDAIGYNYQNVAEVTPMRTCLLYTSPSPRD